MAPNSGKNQMMSHNVDYCHLATIDGGLSRLSSADDNAVQWLATLSGELAYETRTRTRVNPFAIIIISKRRDSGMVVVIRLVFLII